MVINCAKNRLFLMETEWGGIAEHFYLGIIYIQSIGRNIQQYQQIG